MSIYGISNSSISRPATPLPLRDSGRTQTQQPGTTGLQSPAALPAQKSAIAKPAQQSVPAEPPPGTDPALWSVLSAEERGFFAKAGAMGPLTYGRALREMKSAEMPASRGGRLDVKI
ncbi:MAG: hypothetical protein JWM41_4662 [Gemmatimonadetes bacterium]|nr:hypothetical protein [Gemmatimonadota bacterium]